MRTSKELVEFIRQEAHKAGTSLTKIEEEVGLSNGRIGKWKGQRKYPPLDTLTAIANILNMSLAELTGAIDGKENPTPESAEFIPGYEDLSEENKAKARDFIAFLLSQQ